jgi:O-antigen/teichoic acid export membrane protein
MGFSKWLYASTVIVYLIIEGDDLFIGLVFGTTTLGLYQLAYRISSLPTTEITHVISKVTFPSFSIIQDDKEKRKVGFLKNIQIISLISIPISAFTLIYCEEIIKIFFRLEWWDMIPIIQILCIWGAIRSIGAARGSILTAINKPRINTIIQLIQLILMYILFFPFLLQCEIIGVSFSIVISALFSNLYGLFILKRILRINIRVLLKIIFFPLIISICSLIIGRIINFQMIKITPIFNLFLSLCISLMIFGLLSIIVERKRLKIGVILII